MVTATTRRLFALLEAAAHEPGTADFLFTVQDKTSPDGVLEAIWTSPRLAFANTDPVFVSLLDLFEQKGNEDDG